MCSVYIPQTVATVAVEEVHVTLSRMDRPDRVREIVLETAVRARLSRKYGGIPVKVSWKNGGQSFVSLYMPAAYSAAADVLSDVLTTTVDPGHRLEGKGTRDSGEDS